MAYAGSSYEGTIAAESPLAQRLSFIRKTYLHLTGAMMAFVALSAYLYTTGVGERILEMISVNRYMWLLILGAFLLVGYMASGMAHAVKSQGVQYAGLALMVVAEALIFSPLIFLAATLYPGAIQTAAGLTLLAFGALTLFVMLTGKDFSFLRGALMVGMFVALGLIVASVIFGFTLGVIFSGAMILFAAGAVLYSTSRVLHEFRTNQYVAASLELFAAMALMFWYVLQLVMSLGRN